MIYQVTHADPSGRGSIEPDDMTGLELVNLDAVTDTYVPVSGSVGEPISIWDEATASWVEVE
jgi:hypothetical protein|tara:strand:+ start:1608 stop:1793 length:186 start_codon:yes stop_codon:yes gene_type:complete